MPPDNAPLIPRRLGYIEGLDGQVQAVLGLGETVYLVREGETFADRYRAVKVSPYSVEVIEALPDDGPSPRAASPKLVASKSKTCLDVASDTQACPSRATLKPIGYVELASGQIKAIVVSGDEVYLVRQGDVLANRYRVLSASPESVEVVEDFGISRPVLARRAGVRKMDKSRSRGVEVDRRKLVVWQQGSGFDLHRQALMPDNPKDRR
ncbi:MAG: hypothetical protein LAN62_01260 [Acidobacteriia bacterium]|nr:hypothetical protein [Terriglobia bacterium]